MKENRGRFVVGLAMVLGLVCYGRPAQAATLNVPGDYATIQSAINAANTTGDTVLLDDGIYTENINFLGKAISMWSDNRPMLLSSTADIL